MMTAGYESPKYIYSIESADDFEKVAVGQWVDGKWTVINDLLSENQLDGKFSEANSSSKINEHWAQIK